jgi:hypothetical protein
MIAAQQRCNNLTFSDFLQPGNAPLLVFSLKPTQTIFGSGKAVNFSCAAAAAALLFSSHHCQLH